MQDALYLFHIVRGPLRTLAQNWMCRSLRRSVFGESAGLNRYCPSCHATTINDGRAIAIGNG